MPWVTALAQKLLAEGDINLKIVSYNPFADHDETVTQDGIDYTFLSVPDDKWDLLRGYQGRIRRVQTYLRDVAGQYDLLHIHGAEQQYHAMADAVQMPKVLSAQGFVTEYYRHLPLQPGYRHLSWMVAGYYERRYLPSVKHIICRTHWDKAFVRRWNPDATIHHNWELMRPTFYQPIAPGPAAERNAVLFVGGTQQIKGIREALRTVDYLRQSLPIRLIVTGQGNQTELLAMAAKMGLRHLGSDALEHRGMLSETQLWAAYHEAFCLLHPSYIDNSPNSVSEAQLAGLPVVASDVGGVASLVETGQTGLLTSLNVPNIAGAVACLYHDDALRYALADQARIVSLQRFDPEQIVQNTKAIYEDVLEEFMACDLNRKGAKDAKAFSK
jgi:glycosyltransferase involved in cell wall biosynthesis